MKSTITIIIFFILGIFCGAQHLVPTALFEKELSFYSLMLLMFFVGIGIGRDPEKLRSLRTINIRLAMLPLVTVVGTLAGSALVSLLLSGRSLNDCLMVGSGFGYYSLSTILITEYRGAELGAVALISNILREVITLLFTPFIARKFGLLAPISVGGATSIDTTLPTIIHTIGQQYIPISIFHGFLFDFIVPSLLTLFASL